MFQGASSFNQNIGGWNTSKFYDVSGMFKSASSFNQNIGGWDTSRIANMANMFDYASSFNQDLTSWCVSRISSEPSAFAGNTSALTNPNKPIWATCGKLTSSDTDNYVTPSTTVTITAEYNKTSTNTPQISITSVVTNTNMTPVTGINSFTYNWLVSSALADGKYYATLSGTDLYNNTYSGSNSITFVIDNTAPTDTFRYRLR
jgi:surface protein